MVSKPKKSVVTPRASSRLTIGVGLVSFEVGIAPLVASGSKGPSGKTLCPEHHHPIKQAVYCAAGDHYCESTVVGFEHAGQYVFVDRDDAAAEKNGRIELERMVEVSSIDPMYYEKTYLIWPTDGHGPAYDLIAATLRSDGKDLALVGKCVFTRSTRMIVLRFSEAAGCLLMHLCQFDANLRWHDLELVSGGAAIRPEPAEAHLQAASTLLDTLAGEFEPAGEDDYRLSLENLIEAAANGVPVEAKREQPAAPVIDLMAALQASVEQAKKAKAPAKKKPAKVAA